MLEISSIVGFIEFSIMISQVSSFGISYIHFSTFQEQSEDEERLLTDDEEIPMSGTSEVDLVFCHFARLFVKNSFKKLNSC